MTMRPVALTRLLAFLVAGVMLGPEQATFAQDQPRVTSVILVRHAEKVAESRDPPLSPAGVERAGVLVHVLGHVPIEAIYATPYVRTRDTARPLAEALGLPVTELPVTPTYAADLAELIRMEHGGGVVLVVGHSNTTPDVIGALGVADPPTIADDQYDDLFIVTLAPDGAAQLLALRYGRPRGRAPL